MFRSPTVRALLVVALIVTCALSRRAAAASEDSVESLVRRGIELRKEQKDEEALPFFRKAYFRARTPRAAAQLGLCEQALGLWVAAEEHLLEALAAADDEWIRKNRATLERSLQDVDTHLATVELRGAPNGAQVRLDGVLVGTTPLGKPLRVVAGVATLEVSAPGHEPAARRLVTEPQGLTRETVELQLARGSQAFGHDAGADRREARSESVAVDGEVDGPPEERRGWMRSAAWIGAGASVAALGMGVVGHVLDQRRTREFDEYANPAGLAPDAVRCNASRGDDGGPGCAAILERQRQARVMAIGGYVTAAILAAASVTLFWLSGDAPPRGDDQASSCAPSLSARDLGLACRVPF